MFVIKFLQKDIISGSAEKVGDIFTAMFLGEEARFNVTEIINSDMFFAEPVE
jgi:hypothetical protein